MDKRLQLLLDDERYVRVKAEAERTGMSVSAVIRGAIDIAFPGDAGQRVTAAGALVEMASVQDAADREPEWAEIKSAFDDPRAEALG